MSGIYVETFIRGTMEELWEKTQRPELHERWDLRFTEIDYLPRPDSAQPQRFLYATRIGFGLCIRGEGESVGNREGAAGQRSSALKFWSEDTRSLIEQGSGYWQYLPQAQGIRFLTWYDYQPRFGGLGRAVDSLLFRPLMGWATAWSFDRLRLWIERGLDPATTLQNSLIHGVARVAVAFVWLYQGIVPKLLLAHADELTLMQEAGVAPDFLPLLGWAEVLFGLLLLLTWHQRWPFLLTIFLMLLALADVALHSPGYLGAAFNPMTLNGAVIALSLIGYLASRHLPSARHCLRTRPEERA